MDGANVVVANDMQCHLRYFAIGQGVGEGNAQSGGSSIMATLPPSLMTTTTTTATAACGDHLNGVYPPLLNIIVYT